MKPGVRNNRNGCKCHNGGAGDDVDSGRQGMGGGDCPGCNLHDGGLSVPC